MSEINKFVPIIALITAVSILIVGICQINNLKFFQKLNNSFSLIENLTTRKSFEEIEYIRSKLEVNKLNYKNITIKYDYIPPTKVDEYLKNDPEFRSAFNYMKLTFKKIGIYNDKKLISKDLFFDILSNRSLSFYNIFLEWFKQNDNDYSQWRSLNLWIIHHYINNKDNISSSTSQLIIVFIIQDKKLKEEEKDNIFKKLKKLKKN